MADLKERRPENVAGDFFVDSSCIDCDLCRQLAPQVFADRGDQSAVVHQPGNPEELHQALKALVTCPTSSIGTQENHSAREAAAAFPELIEGSVHFCGFASEDSYGASSYLLVRPGRGNVLVDSPRFSRPLARRIEELGGLRWIFLTHRDDVADHAAWAKYFHAERILHYDEVNRGTRSVERQLTGNLPIPLDDGDDELLILPTPGHTKGHCVLLFQNRYLFTGDHLWWSPEKQRLAASRSVCWYDWTLQTRSMEKLLDYTFQWVLPGHGRRFHAPTALMRQELENCLEHMRRAR